MNIYHWFDVNKAPFRILNLTLNMLFEYGSHITIWRTCALFKLFEYNHHVTIWLQF